eukprot:TRINITY_DN1599_c0_g1_i2.p1 TRINITY_DN1599_c0_g1~~TRINITY_DN1599_c0_g1_i2.p1  ORF type:complete len:279 (+),score=57.75 TRINITY_DN1599_c0_g1_i2:149-985(+)
MDNLKHYFVGSAGGISAILVGQPFDYLKVRVQTSKKMYTGPMDALFQTVKTEGIIGLYRGMSAPLLGVAPIFGVSFWGFTAAKQFLLTVREFPTCQNLSIPDVAAAGGLSSLVTSSIITPVERIKCLLQTQNLGNRKPIYRGAIDCGRLLTKSEGLSSLYRGFSATLLRDSLGFAAYFAGYEMAKRYLSKDKEQKPYHIVLAGSFAGLSYAMLAMPADIIKSRMQSGISKNGFVTVATEVMGDYGLKGFYKGFAPLALRAMPAAAACFLGIEAASKFL